MVAGLYLHRVADELARLDLFEQDHGVELLGRALREGLPR
jgi:hypothetical protein